LTQFVEVSELHDSIFLIYEQETIMGQQNLTLRTRISASV